MANAGSTMLFHASFGVSQRAKGHHALKMAAYQAADCYVCADGRRLDFRRKKSEHFGQAILLPESAPSWAKNPELLWALAGAAEKRVDSQDARLVTVSLPRGLTDEQYFELGRFLFQPFVDLGMACQCDFHCPAASDGGVNPHVHGLLTMRRFDGEKFSSAKEQSWNRLFRANKGRDARLQIADRGNQWFKNNGLDIKWDARSHIERGLPVSEELNVPDWQFEAFRKTGKAPEALADLLNARALRRSKRKMPELVRKLEEHATHASQELRVLEYEKARRGASIRVSRVEQRAAFKAAHIARLLRRKYNTKWLPTSVANRISSISVDAKTGMAVLILKSGAKIVDYGDMLVLRGKWNYDALVELAACTERLKWDWVELTGSPSFKDNMTLILSLRVPPVTVTNHRMSREFERKLCLALAERQAQQEGRGQLIYTPLSPTKLKQKPLKTR